MTCKMSLLRSHKPNVEIEAFPVLNAIQDVTYSWFDQNIATIYHHLWKEGLLHGQFGSLLAANFAASSPWPRSEAEGRRRKLTSAWKALALRGWISWKWCHFREASGLPGIQLTFWEKPQTLQQDVHYHNNYNIKSISGFIMLIYKWCMSDMMK